MYDKFKSQTKNAMQDIELSQLKKLIEVVKRHFDMDFTDYAMSSFRRRIQRLLELYKYSSIETLIERVDEGDEKFYKDFLSEITVNVTEMFRDPTFWIELRDHIIPNLSMSSDKKVKVWHAGCSSGEEVFSLAILLKELKLLDRFEIIATDIDHAIISKARKAAYSIKNMELNSKNYERFNGNYSLNKYYRTENGKAVMDESLVENVAWREHNLVEGTAFGKFDLILCRNVMIYFNQTLQNNVLKLFHESLHKYSYLAVGSKESLIWCEIANRFIVVSNKEKIYKKIKE